MAYYEYYYNTDDADLCSMFQMELRFLRKQQLLLERIKYHKKSVICFKCFTFNRPN